MRSVCLTFNYKLLSLIILVAFTLPETSWSQIKCSEIFSKSSLEKSEEIIRDNNFTVTRNFKQYKTAFSGQEMSPISYGTGWSNDWQGLNFTLESVLKKANKRTSFYWLDSGGGDGVAVSDFLAQNKNPNLTVGLISYNTKMKDSFRLKVKSGQMIEQINLTPQAADLITDVYGPMAYSAHPDLVLKKYIDHIKDSGLILINLGKVKKSTVAGYSVPDITEVFGMKNKIMKPDGSLTSLFSWIREIPGIEVKLFFNELENLYFLSIRVLDREKVVIPNLEVLAMGDHTPPRFIFTEMGNVTKVRKSKAESVIFQEDPYQFIIGDFL